MEMQLHSFTKGAEAELVGKGGWQRGQDSGISNVVPMTSRAAGTDQLGS